LFFLLLCKRWYKLKTILEKYFFQIEIEKSKFLGYAIPVQNEEEAKEEINKIKKEHPKATHHCYAYVLKDKQKSNDDGEPAGTAGIPILEIIKQFDLRGLPAKNGGKFYQLLAAYGHMGRTDIDVPWEQTDKADLLREQADLTCCSCK